MRGACYHQIEFAHCDCKMHGQQHVRLRALCDGCSRTPPGPEGSNGNEPLRVPQITRSLIKNFGFRLNVLCPLSVVRCKKQAGDLLDATSYRRRTGMVSC